MLRDRAVYLCGLQDAHPWPIWNKHPDCHCEHEVRVVSCPASPAPRLDLSTSGFGGVGPVLLWAPKPGLASPPAWSQPLPGAPCSLPTGLLTECSRRILLLYTPPPSASSPALFLLLPAQASSSLVTRVPMTEHHHSLSWSFPGASDLQPLLSRWSQGSGWLLLSAKPHSGASLVTPR